MDKIPILLSICIPTYNRSEYLKVAIKSIVEQEAFDKRTEVVVVDNCSTDNTEVVVREFMTQYDNVKYYNNEINIGLENNIIKSLDHGNGAFLKLFNDYIFLEPGSLSFMLDLIEIEIEKKRDVFFLNQNYSSKSNKDDDISYFNDINSFVTHVSFWMTWISCFGVWRQKYTEINNKLNYSGLLFFHTMLMLDLLKSDSQIVVCNKFLFEKQNVLSKSGYDLFYVFLNNFKKGILFSLYEDTFISRKTYNQVSYDLFKRLIFPWFKRLDNEGSKNFNFESKRAMKLIFNEYRYNVYFYFDLVLYKICKGVKNMSLSIFPKGPLQTFLIKVLDKI